MQPEFKRALGALPISKTDYRSVTLSQVNPTVPYLNGVQSFQNDYSLIPVIDQSMEPECVECAAKAYAQKKYYEANKLKINTAGTPWLLDISTRAWYETARMYAGQSAGPAGSEPTYADQAASNIGLIGTTLVPEDRTIDPAVYGDALDITAAMIDDATTKKLPGYATPQLTVPEITNAIQTCDGLLVTVNIDDTWYRYVPGKQELDGSGSELGLHRILLTGFHVKADGMLWVHGRNSWGQNWGIGGDFEFCLAVYIAKMSDPRVYTAIPDEVLQKIHNLPIKPSYAFSVPFRSGMRGPDVAALQDILKYEGLFDLGVASNGIFGALTTKGALAFMERYAVTDIDTIKGDNQGMYIGPLTIAKLNELYGPAFKPKIVAWATIAKSHEGYFPPGTNAACPNGSLSWRNNNPGNFKFANQPNATDANGWACFDTYVHGFDYLCTFLTEAATNMMPLYSATMSLLQFYQVYSPDGTEAQYAAEVAQNLGVTVDTPISNLYA